MTVKLKKQIASAKFGVTFPKNFPLNYSKELKSVQHPIMENIWIRVQPKDFVAV